MTAAGAVVVTGASTGIGAAAAAALARRGFVVFGGVRNATDGARFESTQNHRALTLDVRDASQIRRAADAVAASGLPLRAVVNNAGVAVAGPLEFLPVAELRRQFEVNVFGGIAVTQAFLPLLRRSRGRIVFTGSISGRLPVPYIGPYSASKAALRALAAALRVELEPVDVGVVLVEPGSVRTPIWRKGRDAAEELAALIGPDGRKAYAPVIDAVVRSTVREEEAGLPPECVARAIVRAVTSPSPPAEMLVGGSARAGSVLAMLPARIRDGIMRRSLRLPSHG